MVTDFLDRRRGTGGGSNPWEQTLFLQVFAANLVAELRAFKEEKGAATATVLRLTSLRSMKSLCHAKNNYNFALINFALMS